MSQNANRLLLVLIMLWLPLQGAFAFTELPCIHEENTVNKINTVDIPITDDHQHTLHFKETSNTASGQECEVDTLCHVSCSSYIPTILSDPSSPNCISCNFAITAQSDSFIPEQFQRPPLA